ncbi:hypothetical protein B7494_g5588 [Chlorociboria aeruginascens]|nr:hypothetical protein B7494_g5588 [Chlorociboria aeruginascens]
MRHTFKNVRFALLVGIGSGVPTHQDIRLGDVFKAGGEIERKDWFAAPPLKLWSAVDILASQQSRPRKPRNMMPGILSELGEDYEYPDEARAPVIKNRADADTKAADGTTILGTATRFGSEAVVELLLQHKAFIDPLVSTPVIAEDALHGGIAHRHLGGLALYPVLLTCSGLMHHAVVVQAQLLREKSYSDLELIALQLSNWHYLPRVRTTRLLTPIPPSQVSQDLTVRTTEGIVSIEPSSPQRRAVVVDRKLQNLGAQRDVPPSPTDSVMFEEPEMTDSPITERERRLTRPIDRGAPGDQAIFSSAKTPEQKDLAKRKSQYYGDVFAYREPNTSARERITRESLVVADIRTNVIVEDEYTLTTDLSYSLSSRYQRPESSIIVTVTHSACLLYGGTFDPAYILTINALPSQLQPVTNKRNAALIQKALEDILGVAPDRGVIKFVPVPEDSYATNSRTVAGEVDELEKEIADNNVNLGRSLSKNMRAKKRQSTRSLHNLRNGRVDGMLSPTPDRDSPPIPALPSASQEKINGLDRKAEKVQKISKRKSFMAAVFGK